MDENIIWTDQARAQLRAIDRVTALGILHGIARYRAAREGDVARLQGRKPPELRLRVGDFRVRFQSLPGVLLILAVGHRREIYR